MTRNRSKIERNDTTETSKSVLENSLNRNKRAHERSLKKLKKSEKGPDEEATEDEDGLFNILDEPDPIEELDQSGKIKGYVENGK